MSIKKVPMTPHGFEKLQEELKTLKTTERHKISQAIAQARKHGDLSENAEYDAARERQAFTERRIAYLEEKMSCADVIDVSKLSGNQVCFGATVSLRDEDTKENITYKIVGEEEADIKKGFLSVFSPLSRELIGKQQNDFFEATTPKGSRFFQILSVAYEQ